MSISELMTAYVEAEKSLWAAFGVDNPASYSITDLRDRVWSMEHDDVLVGKVGAVFETAEDLYDEAEEGGDSSYLVGAVGGFTMAVVHNNGVREAWLLTTDRRVTD